MLVAVLFHSFYTGWFSLYLLLFSVALPPFSLLLSFSAMRRAAYHPSLPTRCFCGQKVSYRLTAAHCARMPVSLCWLRLTVIDALSGQQTTHRFLLSGTQSAAFQVDTHHVGMQRFCLTRARVYDALGLFSCRIALPPERCIFVEPKPQSPKQCPNLSQFQYRSYHPKPGGGFSELHDLREYRPGDPPRDIHWKLSVKTDQLIVREAQEPQNRRIVLSFDFSGSRAQIDSTLAQLLWLSAWLLQRQVSHQIDWVEPDSLLPQTRHISVQTDLQTLLRELLQTHLTGDTPTIASRSYAHADWRYHVHPEGQEVPR